MLTRNRTSLIDCPKRVCIYEREVIHPRQIIVKGVYFIGARFLITAVIDFVVAYLKKKP